MKFGSKTIAIALLLVGLVFVNYLASSIPVRLDATAESIYSLSAGTKIILGKLEEPISLDLYFSKDASALPIAYKNYAARVQEMLRQYVRGSRGYYRCLWFWQIITRIRYDLCRRTTTLYRVTLFICATISQSNAETGCR